jgi:hypothetical protein
MFSMRPSLGGKFMRVQPNGSPCTPHGNNSPRNHIAQSSTSLGAERNSLLASVIRHLKGNPDNSAMLCMALLKNDASVKTGGRFIADKPRGPRVQWGRRAAESHAHRRLARES